MGVSVRSVIESTGAADASVGQIASGVTIVDERLSGNTVVIPFPQRPGIETIDNFLARLEAAKIVLPSDRPIKVKLPNGLTIIADYLPNALTSSVHVWVNTGSKNDYEGLDGISHFGEHMVFKGTKKRLGHDIAVRMDELGSDINAFTDFEHTCFHAYVVCIDTNEVLGLFLDMVFNPGFSETDVKKEKKVILQEIKEYKDSPEDHIKDFAYETVFEGHPFGRPVIGTKEPLSKITHDELLRYMADYYTPDNVVVTVSGRFDLSEVVELCKQYSSHANKTRKQGETIKSIVVSPHLEIRHRPLEQTKLIFATSGISILDKDRYAINILDAALCNGFSSRYFEGIRDKEGFAYKVKSITDLMVPGGMFGFYTGIDTEDLINSPDLGGNEGVLQIILRQINRIREEGLTSDELERGKVQHLKTLIMDMDKIESRAEGSGSDELYHGRSILIQESIDSLLAVTSDDVKRVSRQIIFNPRHLNFIILGPKDEMPSRTKLLSTIKDHIPEYPVSE